MQKSTHRLLLRVALACAEKKGKELPSIIFCITFPSSTSFIMGLHLIFIFDVESFFLGNCCSCNASCFCDVAINVVVVVVVVGACFSELFPANRARSRRLWGALETTSNTGSIHSSGQHIEMDRMRG